MDTPRHHRGYEQWKPGDKRRDVLTIDHGNGPQEGGGGGKSEKNPKAVRIEDTCEEYA